MTMNAFLAATSHFLGKREARENQIAEGRKEKGRKNNDVNKEGVILDLWEASPHASYGVIKEYLGGEPC